MEISLFNAVKLVSAAYIIYKVWIWLFRGGAEKHIWSKILTPTPKVKTKPTITDTVIGATKTVVLDDPGRGLPTAAGSTDLEPTGYIGQDEGISADDVESDYRPSEMAIPSDEDLYDDPDVSSYDPELSGGGVTFEQIGEAISVLSGTGTVDETAKSRARHTLIELQHTDILDMITREVCDESTLEQFLNDPDATPATEKTHIKNFDMTVYV